MYCEQNIKFLNFIASTSKIRKLSQEERTELIYFHAVRLEKYYDPQKGKYTTYFNHILRKCLGGEYEKELKRKKKFNKFKRLSHKTFYLEKFNIEEREEIQKLITLCSETQLKYFVLRLEGYHQKEIAHQFKVSRQAVNFQLEKLYKKYICAYDHNTQNQN